MQGPYKIAHTLNASLFDKEVLTPFRDFLPHFRDFENCEIEFTALTGHKNGYYAITKNEPFTLGKRIIEKLFIEVGALQCIRVRVRGDGEHSFFSGIYWC